MPISITPTQVIYNNPYQNTIFSFNTVDSKVYLSSQSNKVLHAIGNNIVLKGFELGPLTTDITQKIINVPVAAGLAIQSSTLIESTSAGVVDMDVTPFGDTALDGCRLVVFINYEYLPSIEPNHASIDIYHMDSTGLIITPTFNTTRCLIMLGYINFTKDPITGKVTDLSLGTVPKMLSVNGVTIYLRGLNPANINIAKLSTATSGSSGTSGTSGVGTSGTSGTSGPTTSGTSGTSSTLAGTSGTSGTSSTLVGTSGTSGTSGVSEPTSIKEHLFKLIYIGLP